MQYFSYIGMMSLLFLSSFTSAEVLPRSPSAEMAEVYIISPKDGETVGTELTVKFGLKGMGVSPAGLKRVNTGHHHLLIDAKELPDLDRPMGSEVMHFGGGQTEKTIQLSKGEHTLQLILGDHMHIPHKPALVSERITIFVK